MILDWGSVPDWLAFGLALGVAVATYVNRDRVARFIRRNVTDPPEVTPPPTISSELVTRGKPGFAVLAGGEMGISVTNHGPGTACGVSVDFPDPGTQVKAANFVEVMEPGAGWTLPILMEAFTSELRWDVVWTQVGGDEGSASFSHSPY